MIHYSIVELDLPEVTGACTINGNPGYGTPLTCSDQSSPSTTTVTHKFTNAVLVLPESGIHKCVDRISETPPILKAGNGVASRANCSITFTDFIGDPNPQSPALVSSPDLANAGTFMGKLKARNILANKAVRVKHYQVDTTNTHTLVATHHYIATELKRNGVDRWVLICKDILYRADDEKSQFPKLITGRLSSSISATDDTVVMEADIADWTPYSDYTAVIGGDLLMITNATGTSNSVTLTVARANTINLGARTIANSPESHSAGDEVFRGRKLVNADLSDLLQLVFSDADISSAYYDAAQISGELSTWLGSLDGSIDAIFYESEETTRFLDGVSQSFMLDIYTDPSTGKIVVKATSPWSSTVAVLKEGEQFNYGSLDIEEPQGLYYSRAFLQYDKRKLTESNDDVNFARSSLAFNRSLEGALYYDEEKVKKLGKSIILSNKPNNIEVADLTTVRFAQRFSNRPQRLTFIAEESDINYGLADVVEIVSESNQGFSGAAKQGVRAQVLQIAPVSRSIGRQYRVTAVTYNPYSGSTGGSDIVINSAYDVNLFTAAGGPVSADTFTFIISQNIGQNDLAQALTAGSFPSGSVINLVFTDGAIVMGRGGDGANASASGSLNGFAGGDTVYGASGVTINIYLAGTTPDFGNGTYTADGYLWAPGGGGAAAKDESSPYVALAAGGGGQGNAPGLAGVGTGSVRFTAYTSDPTAGTINAPGEGGESTSGSAYAVAGRGGTPGNAGQSASLGSSQGTPGAAGRALVSNGATINIYTNGNTGRFIPGAGSTPDSLT